MTRKFLIACLGLIECLGSGNAETPTSSSDPWWRLPLYVDVSGPFYKSKSPIPITVENKKHTIGGVVQIGDLDFLDKIIEENFANTTANTPLKIAQYVSKLPYTGQTFQTPCLSDQIKQKISNCDDKAILAMYFLRKKGFPTRRISEGNVVFDKRYDTGKFALQVKEDFPFLGPNMNSHAYLQIFNPFDKAIYFVDPTEGFVGNREYYQKRVLGSSKFQVVPFVVFACPQYGLTDENMLNITEETLVNEFGRFFPQLQTKNSEAWKTWKQTLLQFQSVTNMWDFKGKDSLKSEQNQTNILLLKNCALKFRECN
jgi:hypothetical protein